MPAMHTISISDETFERLVKRAADLNVTVEELIGRLLELAAKGGGNGQPPPNASFDEWKKQFDGWMAVVRTRAHRYPPGFTMDDTRESIYEGCGE